MRSSHADHYTRSRGVKPSRRHFVWLALVPAAFASYFWLPWPETWIETGLLLALIAALFVIDEVTRF